jgi:hypothetical protein
MRKVLVSQGYGAGWSTWNEGSNCEFDPEVIKWVEEGKPEGTFPEGYFQEKYGDDFYDGGLDDLYIEEVEEKFYILENDGAEMIITSKDMK